MKILKNPFSFLSKDSSKNPFSFLPKDSIINYEEVHHNLDEITNVKDPKYKDKLYFLYDKQSDRFVYFFESNVFIINSKGSLEKYTKVELTEAIKIAAVEYTCNYLLLLTKTNQGFICDLKNHIYENYNIFDKGNFLGGFFIKRNPEKDNKYCKLCMVSDKNFIISKIYTEQTEKGEIIFKRKNCFTSKDMKILNYFYNSDFNVIIIRVIKVDFIIVNLKSKYCYETYIQLDNLNHNNIMMMSTFLVRNIYHKLYFIHMNSKIIEFYGLKDLKKKKPPKTIQLEFGVYNQNIKLQFTNNLVFIYNDNNIYIYDIKIKNSNNKILTLNYMRNKDYHTFYKSIKVCGDYLAIGTNFYKTKFIYQTYFDKNIKDFDKDTILVTLRRGNTKDIVKKVLIEIFQKYEIAKLYEILSILIKNNARNERKINYNKKNAYQLILSGKNYFYLNSDEVFTIFSRRIKDRDPIKIVQFMGAIYSLYQTNDIKVDNDIFISTLFYHLNQIKDYTFFESLFKNGLIPLNHKLGLYLVDRATHPENGKDKKEENNKNKDIIFDYGIENLMEKEEYIGEVLEELMNNGKYFESFDLASYYLYEKIYNKQGKFGYFKNFMTEGFGNFLKSDNTNNDEKNDEESQNNENNIEKGN